MLFRCCAEIRMALKTLELSAPSLVKQRNSSKKPRLFLLFWWLHATARMGVQ
jgi:hypothetical protein